MAIRVPAPVIVADYWPMHFLLSFDSRHGLTAISHSSVTFSDEKIQNQRQRIKRARNWVQQCKEGKMEQ
jgi:hypothetical protein